jgi:(p)ppGpp synthase/HD superfamily hydrolase
VQTAFITCSRSHRGQARKDGSSALQHCMATATILADLGCPAEVVAAALLHDVLRHSTMTVYQLEEFMPSGVVELVQKVTELSEWSQKYRDNQHLLLSPSGIVDMITGTSDVEAVLIKLAHRLQDLRTISALPRCKQVRMATESLELYSVLANRLGSWYLKAQIEDLAFKILQPEEYADVASQVERLQRSRALERSLERLREQLHAAGVPYHDISGRIKNLYSIHKKMRKAGAAFADVYDVIALRVVVDSKHDCYRAMRGVQECWAPVPARFKDYIRVPKGNGYQSLHETFVCEEGQPFEVQVRRRRRRQQALRALPPSPPASLAPRPSS